MFGGELGFKVISVYSDKDFVRLSYYSLSNGTEVSNDLSMHLYDGGHFHICGNNDWAFLALDLLKPIKDEAKKIVKTVHDRKNKSPKIKAVMLGKNDKRIMDVYFGGRGECDKILGIPVIETDNFNEVEFLVEDTYISPFN